MKIFELLCGRRHRAALILVPALFLSACGPSGQVSNSTISSGNLKWDHFPVSIRVDSSLQDGSTQESDLRAAVQFWESRAGNKKLFDLGSWPSGELPFTGPAASPTSLLDNVVFFMDPWPLDPKIAGNTTVHSKGDTIDHAVIFLNPQTELCDDECDGPGDELRTSRRRLLAHELGHFLGFAHVQDPANIMYPEIQPGGSLDDRRIDQGKLDRLTTP